MTRTSVPERLREWAQLAARGETKLFNLGFGDHELSPFSSGGRYVSMRRQMTEEVVEHRKATFVQMVNLAAQKEGVQFEIVSFEPDVHELTYHTQIRVV